MCMLLDLLPLLLVSYIPLPSPLIGMRKNRYKPEFAPYQIRVGGN